MLLSAMGLYPLWGLWGSIRLARCWVIKGKLFSDMADHFLRSHGPVWMETKVYRPKDFEPVGNVLILILKSLLACKTVQLTSMQWWALAGSHILYTTGC